MSERCERAGGQEGLRERREEIPHSAVTCGNVCTPHSAVTIFNPNKRSLCHNYINPNKRSLCGNLCTSVAVSVSLCLLKQYGSSATYLSNCLACVCVCACARARVCACVCVCVRACCVAAYLSNRLAPAASDLPHHLHQGSNAPLGIHHAPTCYPCACVCVCARARPRVHVCVCVLCVCAECGFQSSTGGGSCLCLLGKYVILSVICTVTLSIQSSTGRSCRLTSLDVLFHCQRLGKLGHRIRSVLPREQAIG